jgi:hypothetical protein
MMVRHCQLGLEFKRSQYFASLIIIVAVVVNFFDFSIASYTDDNVSGNPYKPYAIVFALSSILDLISSTIKENIVRS